VDWGKSEKLANPLLAGKVSEELSVEFQGGVHTGDSKIEKDQRQ